MHIQDTALPETPNAIVEELHAALQDSINRYRERTPNSAKAIAEGVLSDALTPMFGDEALRYALALLSPGYLLVAYHFWIASKSINEDIRMVEQEPQSPPAEAGEKELSVVQTS